MTEDMEDDDGEEAHVEGSTEEHSHGLAEVAKALSTIPPSIAKSLAEKREQWKQKQIQVFQKANTRFEDIRVKLMDEQRFAAMDIHEVDSDLMFLASFYSHIVELEGLAVSRRTINERFLKDNVFLLKSFGVVKGRSFDESKSQALRYFPQQLKPLEQEVVGSTYDMSLLGISFAKEVVGQTARSEAIKMIIEVYKKRHETLVRSQNVQ